MFVIVSVHCSLFTVHCSLLHPGPCSLFIVRLFDFCGRPLQMTRTHCHIVMSYNYVDPCQSTSGCPPVVCQEQTMSVWLQTLGEFFWVFIQNQQDLEVYKVMGMTEELDGKAEFCIHTFVQVVLISFMMFHDMFFHFWMQGSRQCSGQISLLWCEACACPLHAIQQLDPQSWSVHAGLAVSDLSDRHFFKENFRCLKEGDAYFAHFLYLHRPPDNPSWSSPKLHMWRCKTWPACIQYMLDHQAGSFFFGWVGSSTDCCCEAFAAGIQRQVPHWTSKGKDDSWEDWVWSYGNGCQTQLNPNCGKEICLAIDIAAIDISQLPFWSQVVLEPWQRVLPADPTRTPPWHPWLLVSKPWLRWNAVASMPCRGRSLSTVSCSCSLFPSFLKIATKQKSRAVDLRATGTQERQPFSTLKAAVQVLLQMHRTRVFCQTFHSRLRAVKKKIHTKYDLFPACLLPELGHHLSWFQKKHVEIHFDDRFCSSQRTAQWVQFSDLIVHCSLFTVYCLLFTVHCSLA